MSFRYFVVFRVEAAFCLTAKSCLQSSQKAHLSFYTTTWALNNSTVLFIDILCVPLTNSMPGLGPDLKDTSDTLYIPGSALNSS